MSSSLDPALPPSYLSSPVMDPCRPNHSGLVAAPGHGYSSRGGVRWARRPLLDGAPVGFNPRRPHPEQVLAGTESPIEEAGDDDLILSQFSTDSIWDVEIVPDSMAEEVKIVPDSFVEEVDMVPDSMPEEVKIVPDSFIEEVDMVPDSLPEVKIVPDSLVEEVEMVPDSLPQEVDNKEVYEYDDCGNVIFTTELVHAFSEECHALRSKPPSTSIRRIRFEVEVEERSGCIILFIIRGGKELIQVKSHGRSRERELDLLGVGGGLL